MFENIVNFFKKLIKSEKKEPGSKDAAKERLHLVLMQDRANVSADFLELMKQEIIEVIKKYIEVDEKEIDVRLTNKENEDGTNGAPALYANIPILNIKNEMKKEVMQEAKENEEKLEEVPAEKEEKQEEKVEEKQEDNVEEQEENEEIIIQEAQDEKTEIPEGNETTTNAEETKDDSDSGTIVIEVGEQEDSQENAEIENNEENIEVQN